MDWAVLGAPWFFHDVEFYKEISLVRIKTYLSYLEYFQEGNGLLECHLVSSD